MLFWWCCWVHRLESSIHHVSVLFSERMNRKCARTSANVCEGREVWSGRHFETPYCACAARCLCACVILTMTTTTWHHNGSLGDTFISAVIYENIDFTCHEIGGLFERKINEVGERRVDKNKNYSRSQHQWTFSSLTFRGKQNGSRVAPDGNSWNCGERSRDIIRDLDLSLLVPAYPTDSNRHKGHTIAQLDG